MRNIKRNIAFCTLAQSYERATQLLNPPMIVRSFADLGAMVAAKKVEGDDLAIMLRAELHAVVVDHDRTKADEAEIAELLKSFSKESVADQRLLLAVRRKIEGLKAEKVSIRRDTLSYARLCKLVKAKAERANAGNDEAAKSEASLLQQHAEGIKACLDAHRQKLAVDMSAAQSELEDLEYSNFFGFFEYRLLRYDPSEALDRLVKVLTDEHNLAEERSGLNGRLIAAISAYENRVAELK
jgi:hypothetical protein